MREVEVYPVSLLGKCVIASKRCHSEQSEESRLNSERSRVSIIDDQSERALRSDLF